MHRAVTLIIVRHPFERLISAYRDKIRENPIEKKYEQLFRKIIRRYRDRKSPLVIIHQYSYLGRTDQLLSQDSLVRYVSIFFDICRNGHQHLKSL